MKISACIIAKNEEENLPRLLKSLQGKFDEIILVDTGSTDKTVEIAKSYGCKVYHREWKGFADARNYAASKATGDWIWHFDADFELEEEEWKKALFFLKNLPAEVDTVTILIKNMNQSNSDAGISSNAFIHRNKPEIKWKGKVHETIEIGISYGLPIFVKHYGYQKYNVLKSKAERNLRLLNEEIKNLDKNSEDYFIKLFYVVQSYTILAISKPELWDKVTEYGEEFIQSSKENIRFFSTYIYFYLIQAYLIKKEYEKALKRVEEVLKKQPDYPDFVLLKGEILSKLEKYQEAAKNFIKFVRLSDRLEKNPFKLTQGTAIVSDKLGSITRYITDDIPDVIIKSRKYKPEDLFKFWLQHRGENMAFLVLNTLNKMNEKEFIKNISKKIMNVHNTEKILEWFVLFAYENDENKLLNFAQKRLIKLNKENPALLLIKGENAFKQKDYENAFYYYNSYLQKTNNPAVLPKIKETLLNLGLEKEAKELEKKLNRISKK